MLGLGQQDQFQVPQAKGGFECPLNGVSLGSRPGCPQIGCLMGSGCINQGQRHFRGSELLSAWLLGFSALPPPLLPSEMPSQGGWFPPCCHHPRDEDLAGLWPW